MFVVPLPSERCTARIGTTGRVVPGFAAAIALSFQVVILPM